MNRSLSRSSVLGRSLCVASVFVSIQACSGSDDEPDDPSPTSSGGTSTGSGGKLASGGTTLGGGGSSTGGIVAGPGGRAATETGGVTGSVGGRASTGGSASGGSPISGTGGAGGRASTGGGAGSSSAGSSDQGGTTSTGGAGTGGRGAGTGGRGAGGSTGGAPEGGSGGASGGPGTCSVSPVSPNATQQAKNLLCYLYQINGKGVLSGQQETSWSNPQGDISFYQTNTGKLPAILGGDYLYPMGTTDRAIAYWNAGGITMIRYHMGAPPSSDTYENSKGTANINDVLTSGTNANASFEDKLEYVAQELKKLETAGVPVLWAPFHEFQPNGWFWWSKGSAAQFKQLWQYMFDYLVTENGLKNLVWLAPSSGSPSADWYPAKQYYDLAGPDTYDTGQPFASMYNQVKGIVSSSVPIPLHETGKIVQPAQMFPTAAPWVLFNVWAGYQSDTSKNSLQSIKDAYSSSYTITRDEVPNLK